MNVDQGGTWARSVTHQNTYTPDTIHGAADWIGSALCAQEPAELFYIEKGGGSGEAKKICGACEHRAPCLADAMKAEGTYASTARYGIFAGLTPSERAKLHTRGWKAGDPLPPIRHYGQQSTGDAA